MDKGNKLGTLSDFFCKIITDQKLLQVTSNVKNKLCGGLNQMTGRIIVVKSTRSISSEAKLEFISASLVQIIFKIQYFLNHVSLH